MQLSLLLVHLFNASVQAGAPCLCASSSLAVATHHTAGNGICKRSHATFLNEARTCKYTLLFFFLEKKISVCASFAEVSFLTLGVVGPRSVNCMRSVVLNPFFLLNIMHYQMSRVLLVFLISNKILLLVTSKNSH